MKVVINKCYGGFGISDTAVKWMRENKPCEHEETIVGETYKSGGIKKYSDANYGHSSYRNCDSLVAAIENLGNEANGEHAKLYVTYADVNNYSIKNYDGKETICDHGCDC